MCGIVGYVGPRDAVPVIVEGLRRLEYRGYDSAGVAVVRDGAVWRRRAAGKLQNLVDSLEAEPLAGSYGVGHTRWATHGRPSEENAHPHLDDAGRIVVVHNGIVENYLELKARLRAAGHRFVTQTDTEALAHLIAHLYEGSLEGALKLKEVSYLHAEGYPAGEMKHGPIALVDESLPVVALCPAGRVYEKMLSSVQEVKARGGRVLAVASGGDPRLRALLESPPDALLEVPATDELWSPLLMVLPLQLLAYHVAVRGGRDVDQPRNLAKSVTVE